MKRYYFLCIAVCILLALPYVSSAEKLLIRDNSGNPSFVVTDGGYTGIGTTDPISPLTFDTSIAGSVPAGVGVSILQGNVNKERIELRSAGDNVGSVAGGVQGKAFGGSIASPTATKANHILLLFGGSGHDGTDVVITNRALLKFMAGENWSTTAQGTYINFETTQNGTISRTEKMRLTGDGKVGIGTISPTALLDVNSNLIRVRTAKTPSSSSEACNQGEMAWDTNNVYVCVSTNTWKRSALSTW